MRQPRLFKDPRTETRLDSILTGGSVPQGFYNNATGFGTARDKSVYTAYGTFIALDTTTLAGLYHGHDLSARVVDVVPDEELRLPFKVCVEPASEEDDEKSDSGKKEGRKLSRLVKREFKRLNVREHVLLGRKWGRCFGGAATIIGADDGRPASWPLDPTGVEKINWLRTVDRRYLWPNTWYTSGEKNGQVETYFLDDSHPGGSQSFVIHESRLILWPGVTTAQREKDRNFSWDHSVLDRCWAVLKMFETLYKGVELLITDGPQAIYKVKGLIEAIAAGQEDAVLARLEITDLMRSVCRAIVIDAGNGQGDVPEDFTRQQATYSGTPEILTQIQLRLSAAVQIPMLILFGQAPGGLGVTGENDLRWFFDRTASSQLNTLGPRIERLAALVLEVEGYDPEELEIEVEFKPLWTPTAKEEAETRFAQAQTDAKYIESLVITPEEVGLSRFSDDGEWHPDWKAYDRPTRIKMLEDILANLKAGSEVPGNDPANSAGAATGSAPGQVPAQAATANPSPADGAAVPGGST